MDSAVSIYSPVLRKFDHSDMRSEVAIHQSNKNFTVPEIPNIQNHVILKNPSYIKTAV